MNKKNFYLAVILAAALFLPLQAVTLVKDGKAVSRIVIGPKPTRAAQFGALELQHVIKLITGAALPVSAQPGKGTNIFIGEKWTGKKFQREQYSVSFKDGNIYLEGKEDPDYGKVDYRKYKTFPSVEYRYRSSLFAVYDFLEKCCGVRFYDTGDLGIVRPAAKTLKVKEISVFREPDLGTMRYIHFYSQKPVSARDRALFRLRTRQTINFGQGNHTIWSLYYRYWGRAKSPHLAKVFIEKRPEYFAQGYKGANAHSSIRDTEYPGDVDLPPQICQSHPDVIEYFADEAYRVMKGEKVVGARFNYARPMEGIPFSYPVGLDDNNYRCKCPECARLMIGNNHSPLQFTFYNKLARAFRKKDPQMYIQCSIYSNASQLPENMTFEKNMSFSIALSVEAWFLPGICRKQHGLYRRWLNRVGKEHPFKIHMYMLQPDFCAKNQKYKLFFPRSVPRNTGRLLQGFIQDGVQGFSAEIFNTKMPELLLTSRMAYDSKTDPEKFLDEYYRLYYGKAAPAMKKFYERLEEIIWNPKNHAPIFRNYDLQGSFFNIDSERNAWYPATPERMKELTGYFNEALKLAGNGIEKKRVQDMYDRLWKPCLEGYEKFTRRMEQNKKVPPPVIETVYDREYNGDLAKVDFSKAVKFTNWRSKQNAAVKNPPVLHIASDDKWIYFQYAEKGPGTLDNRSMDMFKNNVEIFLVNDVNSGEYFQMVISPDKDLLLANKVQEGVPSFKPWTKPGAYKLSKELTKEGWRFKIAFSKKELGIRKTLRFNVMRTRHFDDKIGWQLSPLLDVVGYVNGMHRLATLLSGEKPQIRKVFTFNEKWIVNRPKKTDTKNMKFVDGIWEVTKNSTGISIFAAKGTDMRPGHVLRVSFTAKGTGKLRVGYYGSYGKKIRRFLCSDFRQQALTGEKKKYVITLPVRAEHGGWPLTWLSPMFRIEPGAAVTMDNVEIKILDKKGEK